MLEFTKPVEHFGYKFDRGMILYEFDALREPEKTRFPLIGDWVKARCEMDEIPAPSMLWRGKIVPDLYISNQLEGLTDDVVHHRAEAARDIPPKHEWSDELDLENASITLTGQTFHDTFIEPMCAKISGRKAREISAKYHRAIWLPLYWGQTLRSRQSLRTPFYYPKAGYAGAVAEGIGTGQKSLVQGHSGSDADCVDIKLAHVVARPRTKLSVLLVVEKSPIYRITDQDACAGIDTEFHRYVVEYRGPCSVSHELQRLGLIVERKHIEFSSFRMTLPTIRNVLAGWKPKPTINDQLWSHIESEAIA